MSASSTDLRATVAHLCHQFLSEDLDAQGWAFLFPDESQWESPDCDEMSRRFIELAQQSGVDGHLVHLESLDEGSHWLAVLTSRSGEQVAVDWTARQFFNAGHPAPATDPRLIPCPLVFDWPGTYPLPVVTFALA